MTSVIYALVHPVTNEVRYIGKTVNPRKRYHHHAQDNTSRHRAVCRWWDQLEAEGMRPVMCIIASVVGEDWESVERALIAQYREDGSQLLNMTDGGFPAQFKPQSDEVRSSKLAARAHLKALRARAKRLLGEYGNKRRRLSAACVARNDAIWADCAARAPHVVGRLPWAVTP